jgi:hypothetical protein
MVAPAHQPVVLNGGQAMKRWIDFAAEQPEMAEAGHALIYQHRVGLGYLATVRKDGGPRGGGHDP